MVSEIKYALSGAVSRHESYGLQVTSMRPNTRIIALCGQSHETFEELAVSPKHPNKNMKIELSTLQTKTTTLLGPINERTA